MKIDLGSSGLWELRDAVELMTSGKALKLPICKSHVDVFAGWGHKPTAAKVRQTARRLGKLYLAFEDGFLRSVLPGDAEKPIGMVMDRTGIYYDAFQPSDLVAFISRQQEIGSQFEANLAIEHLRESRLSKYNHAQTDALGVVGLLSSDRADRVLVIDQTAGDASILGAGAQAETFDTMLKAAAVENPEA